MLPLTLLLAGRERPSESGAGAVVAADWEWAVLGNNVALFSLWPLLVRDGQAVQYWALALGWNAFIIGYSPFARLRAARRTPVAWASAGVHAAMLGVHALELGHHVWPTLAARVFARYPDLFPVLHVLVATPVFVLLWLWSLRRLVEIALAVGVVRLGMR